MLLSLKGNTKFAWLLLLLASVFIPLNAALIDYNFTTTTGTYQEITGGTEFTILNGTTYADDQRFVDPAVLNGGTSNTGVGLPIGFNLSFNETIFDVIGINNNGWISFGQSTLGAEAVNMAYSSIGSVLSSTSTITPAQLTNRVAALNRDLQAQSSSSLRMQTIGSAPNQICVIQYKNYKRYSTTGTGDSLNFQIRLYQTSNKIEIVYGHCVSGANSTANVYQVGMRGPAVTDFHARTTTDNWAATTLASLNTATCTLSQSVYPANGLTFAWNLIPATNPPNAAMLVTPADSTIGVPYSPTLQWSSGGGLPTGYRLFVGTNNPPTNLINNQDMQNVTQYTFTTQLAFLTTYYWKIVPYNNNGQAQNCPVWSFTTQENDIIAPPYVQDFSGSTFPPLFWTRYTGLLEANTTMTSSTLGWITSPNFGNITNSPNGSATKLNNYGSTRKHWIVTPPVNLPVGIPHQLEFNLALTDHANSSPIENNTGVDDRFAVVISTDNGVTWSSANIAKLWDNDSATNSLSYDSIATAGQRIVVNLTPYSGLIKIGFYGESTVTNIDNDLHLDNITIIPVPTQPIYLAVPSYKIFGDTHINNSSRIQNFTIQNLGIGSLGISSITITGPNAVDFTLINNNSMPLAIINGQPIVIGAKFSPLTVGAKTAIIQITDTLGRVVHSIDISGTAFEATLTSFPYTQNFDLVTTPALPSGWEKYVNGTSTGDVVTYTSTTTGIVYSQPNVARLTNASDATGNYILLSPPIQNTTLKRAKFFARSGSGTIPLSVGYMIDAGDISTYNEITSIPLTTTHTEYLVSLGNAPTGNSRLAFKHGSSSTSQTIYIDDVLIEDLPLGSDYSIDTENLTFGNIYANRPATLPIIITNNGQAQLNVNFTLPNLITIDPQSPITCNAGQSVTVSVTLLATPNDLGVYSQNIILNTNDPDCPVDTLAITATIQPPLPDGLIEVGNGTDINQSLPLEPFYRYSYSQSIILASQLALAQNPRIIQLSYNYNGNQAFSDSVKIYMGNTTQDNFNSPNTYIPLDSLQLVYNGILQTTTEAGWISLDLTNFFNYIPGRNLVIALHDYQGGNFHSSSAEFFCTATTNSQSIEYHNDTTNPDPANPPAMNLKSYLPDVRLLFTPIPTGPMFYVNPAGKDFNQVQISLHSAYQNFNIKNIGIGSLGISSIVLSGTDASQFQLVNPNTLPLTLTTNQSVNVQVRFSPTSVGQKNASLIITDSITRTVRTVILVGVGFDATVTTFPHLENFDTLTPPNLPYGWQKIYSSSSTSAYLDTYTSTTTGIVHSAPNAIRMANSNDENAQLILISPFIQNTNGKRIKFFARGSSAAYTLSVGYLSDPLDPATYTEITNLSLTDIHTEYTVSLASLPTGNKQFAFKHGLGGTYRTIYIDDVNVSLLPANPEIAFSPTNLDFGTMFANNTRTMDLNITNNGTQPLTVNWTLPNLVTINPSGITTVQAGQTTPVHVTFAPSVNEIGNYSQNITLATNDPGLPSINIPLTATVLAPLPAGLYQIGEGIVTNQSLPIEPYYRYSYTQTIYHANDLPTLTGQAIISLGYQFNGNSVFNDTISIYVGYTSMNDFNAPNTFIPFDSLELVFTGEINTTTNDGDWIMFDLNPSFEYTPGRNLVVGVHDFGSGMFHSNSDEFYCTAKTTPQSIESHDDTINPNPITPPTSDFDRRNYIPNTRLFIGTNYPRPTNLTANSASGMVNLSWNAPAPARDNIEIETDPIASQSAKVNSISRDKISLISKITPSSSKISTSNNKKMLSLIQNNDDPTRMTLTNYKVYRNDLEIALTPSNTTNFTDTDVVNGTTYYYKVTAVYTDPAGESFPTNIASATPTGSVLNPPVNLTASSTGSTIQLNWVLGELKMYEGFNSSTLPENWSLMDLDSDGNNWSSSDLNPHSGQKCIESISTGLNPNNWLITPSLTLGNNSILSWWVGGQDGTQLGDQYRIYVSTSSSTNFETQLYQEVLTTGNWSRRSINLNAYNNQTIYLAFVHRNSANKQKIRLDDIALSSSVSTAKATKDVNRNLTGFKIYRDHNPIGEVTASSMSYIDLNPSSGDHLYYVTALYNEGESIASNFVTLSDLNDNPIIPKCTALKGNYPNPFNPVTSIVFDLAKDQKVCIEIYNVKGQKVKSLINENRKAGSYNILWNGLNDNNTNVGSGIYFYRMRSGNYTSTGKMILMK